MAGAQSEIMRVDERISDAYAWRFTMEPQPAAADQAQELLHAALAQLSRVGRVAIESARYAEGISVVTANPAQTGNLDDAGRTVTTKIISRRNKYTRDRWTCVEVVLDDGVGVIDQVDFVAPVASQPDVRSGVLARTGTLYTMLHSLLGNGVYFGRRPIMHHDAERKAAVMRDATRILAACAIDHAVTARYASEASLGARARHFPLINGAASVLE